MNMQIIDGKKISRQIREKLKQKSANWRTATGLKPRLAVILIGDDPASHLYVSLKEKAAAKVGIRFEKHLFPSSASKNEIIKTIEQLNNNSNVHGILIQLPLPAGLNTDKIISAINPSKDVDGFQPQSQIEPVLGKAVWRLINEALKPESHRALVIGNSEIFLNSLNVYLTKKGLEVATALADKIQNLRLKIKDYDIVIVAAGQAGLLRGDDFKDGAIVIDIGTNRLPNGQTVGDVDFKSTLTKPGWITPVPGGVGPVTVATLLENTYLCAVKNLKKP